MKLVDNKTKLSKYVTVEKFIESPSANKLNINNSLPESLLSNAKLICELYDKIYEQFKGNVYISSGYRCDLLNSKVGGSKTSQHKYALALDIKGKNGVKNKDIFDWVKKHLKFNQLIWEYGTSKEPNWVHVGFGTKCQILYINVSNSKGFMPDSDI